MRQSAFNKELCEFAIKAIDGRSCAIFTCAAAGGESSLTINCISGKAPPLVRKLASAKGWQTDAGRPDKTRCPDCQRHKTKHDPDSALRKIVPLFMPNPPQTGEATMAEVRDIKPTAPIVAASNLTPDHNQRAAIRNMLDKHFDDSTGRYLDGQSDRAIAERLNLPAIMVKTIREAAYGPELADPELAGIRAELARLEGDIVKLKARLAKLAPK